MLYASLGGGGQVNLYHGEGPDRFSVYFPDKKEGFFSVMRDKDQASTLTRLDMYSLVSVEGKS